jgi:hypothetical protein
MLKRDRLPGPYCAIEARRRRGAALIHTVLPVQFRLNQSTVLFFQLPSESWTLIISVTVRATMPLIDHHTKSRLNETSI